MQINDNHMIIIENMQSKYSNRTVTLNIHKSTLIEKSPKRHLLLVLQVKEAWKPVKPDHYKNNY